MAAPLLTSFAMDHVKSLAWAQQSYTPTPTPIPTAPTGTAYTGPAGGWLSSGQYGIEFSEAMAPYLCGRYGFFAGGGVCSSGGITVDGLGYTMGVVGSAVWVTTRRLVITPTISIPGGATYIGFQLNPPPSKLPCSRQMQSSASGLAVAGGTMLCTPV